MQVPGRRCQVTSAFNAHTSESDTAASRVEHPELVGMETPLSPGAVKVTLDVTDCDGGVHLCQEHMTKVPEHKSGKINALFVLGHRAGMIFNMCI